MLSSRTSMWTTVSPRRHLGEPGRQRGGLVREVRQVGPGRARRGPSTPASRRTPRRRCRGGGPSGGGVSSRADDLERVERGVELRRAATGDAAPAPRRTRSRAPPSRRPRSTAAGARARSSAGAGACGPPRGRSPRTSAGPSRTPPSRSARAVGTGQHRGEAGREAAALRDGVDHGRPAPLLDRGRGRAGGRCGHVSRCAVRPCGMVVGMAVSHPGPSFAGRRRCGPSRLRA